jgi:hemin uptake protein HemP
MFLEDRRVTGSGAGPSAGSKPTPRRTIRSADLFGEAREIVIEHRAEEYRLTITRAGKLILTK